MKMDRVHCPEDETQEEDGGRVFEERDIQERL